MPVTIIIFILFTKWWIVDVVDGTDGIMYGFPFIYKAPAFYTSMALEYFITELILDFSIYFIIIFGIIYAINNFVYDLKFNKIFKYTLWIFAFILLSMEIWIAQFPENKFTLKRDYELKIKKTGFKFFFNSYKEGIEFDKYHK